MNKRMLPDAALGSGERGRTGAFMMILFKFSNIQDETNNYHQSTALPCSSLQLIAEQEWMREMVTTTKAKRKLRCIIMRCTREDALERRSFGFRASC